METNYVEKKIFSYEKFNVLILKNNLDFLSFYESQSKKMNFNLKRFCSDDAYLVEKELFNTNMLIVDLNLINEACKAKLLMLTRRIMAEKEELKIVFTSILSKDKFLNENKDFIDIKQFTYVQSPLFFSYLLNS